MNKTAILNEIKSHYGYKRDSHLAAFLGISPQTISNWKFRNTYNFKLICSKFKDINPEWLLTGKGSMLKKNYPEKDSNLPFSEDPNNNFLSSTGRVQYIPLYELESEGGLKEILKKGSTTTILDIIKIPNLTECDGAAYIKGDSMFPPLKSGNIVIFKGLLPEDIFWGEMYLIEIGLDDKGNLLTIRYLQKSELGETFVKLVSENPDYDSKDIPLSKIKAIALIRASIRFY